MPRKVSDAAQQHLSNKEWLISMHVDQLFSTSEIAEMLTVTPNLVRKALKNLNIVSPSKQQLREASNKRKYGVANPGAVKQFRDKALATMLVKYGGHNWSEGNRDQRDETCLLRYGNTNVAKTDHAKRKARDTNNMLYGRDHANQAHLSQETYDKQWLSDQFVVQRKTLSQIAQELGFGNDMTTVMRHLHKHGVDTRHFQTSFQEAQVVEFLENLGFEVVRNSRDIISPKELDVYIPSHKLAVEFCGVYWHSEKQGKDRLYHRQKYEHCLAQQIQLITMYDWEWAHRRPQVETKFRSLLGLMDNATFARKCEVRDVDSDTKARFLNQYHIQGTGPGSVTHGLYDGGNLVAVMSWIITHTECILNRYATSGHVVGGFTKLLAHFQRTHPWSRIVSFADLRWSSGNLYKRTGFTLEGEIPPDYAYVINGKPTHKFGFRHASLASKLPNYDPNLSEWDNMQAHGYDRIWDCGKLRYVITNDRLPINNPPHDIAT